MDLGGVKSLHMQKFFSLMVLSDLSLQDFYKEKKCYSQVPQHVGFK